MAWDEASLEMETPLEATSFTDPEPVTVRDSPAASCCVVTRLLPITLPCHASSKPIPRIDKRCYALNLSSLQIPPLLNIVVVPVAAIMPMHHGVVAHQFKLPFDQVQFR